MPSLVVAPSHCGPAPCRVLPLVLIAVAASVFPPSASASAPPASSVQTLHYTGVALDPATGDTLFTEVYEFRRRDGKPLFARTEYRDTAGTQVAERTLDFSRDAWKPSYRFRDFRDGYEERAETFRDTVHLSHRERRAATARTRALVPPAPSVVDGGFVPFIRAHWDALVAGKTVPFDFVAVSRLSHYGFEAVRTADAPPGRVAFTVRPRNPVLRALVTPIRVEHDPVTRSMLAYEGTSNIRAEDGKPSRVRIEFSGALP